MDRMLVRAAGKGYMITIMVTSKNIRLFLAWSTSNYVFNAQKQAKKSRWWTLRNNFFGKPRKNGHQNWVLVCGRCRGKKSMFRHRILTQDAPSSETNIHSMSSVFQKRKNLSIAISFRNKMLRLGPKDGAPSGKHLIAKSDPSADLSPESPKDRVTRRPTQISLSGTSGPIHATVCLLLKSFEFA